MNPQAGAQPGAQPGQGQNPFLQLLQKLQSQGPQAPGQNPPGMAMASHMGTPAGGSPVGAGGPMGAPGGMPGQEVQDATLPGQNPGVSKNLMSAMQQLHGAITVMTDPQEIQMIRSIIVLLNQLIQRDQQVQAQQTGQGQPQQPGQSNLRPGAGQPAGAPSPSAM